jgi:hypothetical protein
MILFLFTGCTINMTPPQEQVENKVSAEIETKKIKPWPHVEKEYWYAKYFLSMALNPDVQRVMLPRQVFSVVKCTVDGFEKDYEYERFVKEIGANMALPPQIHKYIYDLSWQCSLEVKRKAEEEQSKNPKPIDVRKTI